MSATYLTTHFTNDFITKRTQSINSCRLIFKDANTLPGACRNWPVAVLAHSDWLVLPRCDGQVTVANAFYYVAYLIDVFLFHGFYLCIA